MLESYNYICFFFYFEITTTGLLQLLYKEHSVGLRGRCVFFSVFMGEGSQNITKKMFSRARLKFPCFFGGVKVNDAE